MKRIKTLVFIYNSFNDPLFQNLVLSYLKTLAKKEGREFHVITFEQVEYAVSEENKKAFKRDLAKDNIFWYPLKFHTGKFLLLKKAYDLLQAIFLVAKIRFVKGAKVVFAFANVSASYSVLFSRLLKMKLLIFSYEPHSAFMEELGLWSKDSMKFKFLNSLENLAGMKADYVLTGTKFMVERLQKRGAKGGLFRAPTGINSQEIFPTSESLLLKEQLGLGDRKVLFYIGKFGDLYYKEEVPMLFQLLQRKIPDLFFLILTPNDLSEIEGLFVDQGIDANDYMLVDGRMDRKSINKYIGVGSIGLSAVPPTPSQKFRSPTKVGEYLMSGIPFITMKGISEDDIYAKEANVGVVLKEFTENEVLRVVPEIQVFLTEDKEQQIQRCRKVGLEYRSKQHVVDVLETIYNEL